MKHDFLSKLAGDVRQLREEEMEQLLTRLAARCREMLAEQAVGEGKERLGEATDNEDLENAGKRDQVSGEAKEAGHDLRDKAAGAVDDVRDKLRGDK